MDYVKLWTTLHDDPDVARLSDHAFRAYIASWSWCGRHETDGAYDLIAGLVSRRALRELVDAGKFIAIDAERYQINAWGKRQVSVADIEKRRAAGKAAADARWSASRSPSRSTPRNANRIAVRNTEEQVKEQVEEQTTPSAPRKRDALFDALAEATGRDPYAMTRREARACATALADIRRASPDTTPAEIITRAEHYRLHMPQATLTPSALASHWSLCARPPKTRDRFDAIASEVAG